MKKDVADKWAAALRSGEYKQGTMRLHTRSTDSYCCLGVLCELAAKEIPIEIAEGCGSYGKCYELEYTSPPAKVRKWAGLLTDEGSFFAPNFSSLMELNDSEGRTFTEIADVIEKHWEEL